MKKITYILALLFTGIISAQTIGKGSNTLTGAGAEISVDEISITSENDTLKLLDRSSNIEGQRGYKRPLPDFNWSDIPSSYANSIIEIRYDYDLGTDTITLPENVTLKFEGGILKNGTIEGNNTNIKGEKCLSEITLTGTFNKKEIDTRWFGILNLDFDVFDLNIMLENESFSSIYIPSGHYTINGTIQNYKAFVFNSDGVLTFDFKDSENTSSFIVGELSNSDLQTLSAPLLKYTREFTFSSAHGLSEGDIISFIDDTDGSYTNYRDYYKKGEFKKVLSVDGLTITFDTPLYFSYGSGDKISKINMQEWKVSSPIKIIAPDLTGSIAVKLFQIKDSAISNIDIDNGSYACLELSKCFNIQLTNINNRGVRLSGSATDYGIYIMNCNKVSVQGHYISARHALTTSGNTDYPSVTNLDIKVEGIFETNVEGEIEAINTHGNTENFVFNGIINGGISLGGEKSKVSAIISASPKGRTVYFSELSGYNHDLSGCQHYGNDFNPYTELRGLIDLGGNTIPNSDIIYPDGVLNFANSTIDASSADRLIQVRNRVTGDDMSGVVLDLSNVKMLDYNVGATTPIYLRNDESEAEGLKKIMLQGIYDANEVGITLFNLGSTIVTEDGGHVSTSIALDTGVTSVGGSVIFPEKRLTVPNVSYSIPNTIVASDSLLVAISSVTVSGFDYTIYTSNNSNFGTTSSITINFIYN